ncbi:MAG TPA: hypothetical protein PLV52_07620 [Candidatus Omnitrophota bacterium]|nr:hypothetical protein [Candidatus Omnitrophota bacterium]
MTPKQALEIALAEELKAIELYKRLGNEDPSLSGTFAFLVKEEENHRDLLEEIMRRLD